MDCDVPSALLSVPVVIISSKTYINIVHLTLLLVSCDIFKLITSKIVVIHTLNIRKPPDPPDMQLHIYQQRSTSNVSDRPGFRDLRSPTSASGQIS